MLALGPGQGMGIAVGIGMRLHHGILVFAGLVVLGWIVGVFLGNLEWNLLVYLADEKPVRSRKNKF